MHDPLVVAHTIIRPWPQRTSLSATGSHSDGIRWRIRHYHTCTDYCREHDLPHRQGAFPWWKPRSYARFWRLAGRDWYWPELVTIWHREPDGKDALTVCQRRYKNRAGQWRYSKGWRWHVWHWRIQVPPLQRMRRQLLTRCAWCGGPSRKGDLVNHSHSWDGQRSHWWQGEKGLYHHDCSSIERAHHTCQCFSPLLGPGELYGTCAICGKFRPYGHTTSEAGRLLNTLPKGARLTGSMKTLVEEAWQRAAAQRQRPLRLTGGRHGGSCAGGTSRAILALRMLRRSTRW